MRVLARMSALAFCRVGRGEDALRVSVEVQVGGADSGSEIGNVSGTTVGGRCETRDDSQDRERHSQIACLEAAGVVDLPLGGRYLQVFAGRSV